MRPRAAGAALRRRLYRGARPGRVMRILNRLDAALYGLGLAPRPAAVLEVVGRRTGAVRRIPLAPGARAHVRVPPGLPEQAYAAVARDHPVFALLPYR
ncbi:hypothetical protein GCM10009584_27000 [Ornithinimicrobium humiphilum]